MVAKKRKPTRGGETLREEMVQELKHLRGTVREIGENFILRREGEIETIIGLLATIPAVPLKKEAPEWLHEIRSLKLKPGKGRLKDLKGLDLLCEALADLIMTAQDSDAGGSAGKRR